MSLIHCSPLFHPLEPLPVMGPAAMRTGGKMHFDDAKSVKATGKSTDASKKGKKAALLRAPMLSPASTTFNTPVSAGTPYSMRQSLHIDNTTTKQAGQSPTHALNYGTIEQSHEVGFLDSQNQGSLTFTTESQPMEDLSSSQQIHDRGH